MTTSEHAPNGGWGFWPTPTVTGINGGSCSRKAAKARGRWIGGTPPAAPPAPPSAPEDPQLTLFAADSLASPSPSQGNSSRRRIAGGSGPHSTTSFASYDPGTCSWRTFQGSLLTEWETYSETWPPAGMTRNGTAFRRPSSVPPIYATGSSLWPTPVAHDDQKSLEAYRAMRARTFGRDTGVITSLTVMVKAIERDMCPTPKGSAANYGRPRENDRGDLQAAVMNWPTPTARLGTPRGPQAKRYFDPARSNDLDDAVAATGTPGQLNPAWVEWLMGYPAGWTDSED
jgi:hypothetical protein